jgi:sugar/nucleoside kinase (ribokinase family)
MRRGVIAGGNFIVDYVKTIDVFPAEQTLANISREYMGSGGAPYNVLLSLSKLEADFHLEAIGRIGADDAGRFILEDCGGYGVDVSRLVSMPDAPTSYTLVMVVEGTGRRTFFHQRGANALLDSTAFDFESSSASHFHYGYLLLLDEMDAADAEYGTAAARVLARAKQAGLTTSVDLVSEDSDRFRSVVPPALKFADIAFMNEFEAGRLTGLPFGDEVDAELVRAARANLGFEGTLVVHWAGGAVACSATDSASQGSVCLPPNAIASVAGCGDAFAAGYLLNHLRWYGLQDSLKLGVCAAAACAGGFTCTDAIAHEWECLALGDGFGFWPVVELAPIVASPNPSPYPL